jgi:hypothetical protein
MGERSETHRCRRRHKVMGLAALTHPTRAVRFNVIANWYYFSLPSCSEESRFRGGKRTPLLRRVAVWAAAREEK